MKRTREEACAYSRGYAAGMRRAWPAYHPPAPPEPLVAAVMLASKKLADHVANWCGAFGEDDEFYKEMQPLLDATDKAHSAVTAWLKTSIESPADAGTPQATAGSSRRAGTPENATPGATGSGAVTCGPASSQRTGAGHE